VLAVGITAWRPIAAGVWHDDGVYMLVGKAIAEGHGLTYQGVVGAPPAAKFPPGYPAALAVLWLLLGSIGPVTLAATLLNLVCIAVAAGLFAKALADSGAVPLRLAALLSGLAFVSTDLIRTALIPLSESFFLLLVTGAFALWRDAAREEGGRARLGVALLLALACVTRSAGLAFVVAFGLGLVARRGWKTAAAVTGPALATTALWMWWSAARAAEIPEGMRDLLGPYGSWLAGQTLEAPGPFLAGLPAHAGGVAGRIAALLVPGVTGAPFWIAAAVLLALAAVGTVRALGPLPPLAWSIPAYLGMLLLWPYLDRRLVVPLHPAMVAAACFGGLALLDRVRPPRARTALYALALAWVATYAIVTATRIATDWPVAPYRVRADRLAAGVVALDRTAPEDAVVGAAEYWPALHLHGGWTVAPSVRFDPRSVDPAAPMWGTPDEQIALWRAAGIDHILLEQGGTLHGAALDQLEAACPGSVFLLAQSPPLMVVRIEWGASCGAPGTETRPPGPGNR